MNHQSGISPPLLLTQERADKNRFGFERPASRIDTGVQNWPLAPKKFVSTLQLLRLFSKEVVDSMSKLVFSVVPCRTRLKQLLLMPKA